jgi:uncharacterized DUF497 family protein
VLDLNKIAGFDWDDGNNRKSADKHGVSPNEAEQVFVNRPLIVAEDMQHSAEEVRFHALGKTGDNKLLQVTFTLRENGAFIRIISARPMNRKERAIYEGAGSEEKKKT